MPKKKERWDRWDRYDLAMQAEEADCGLCCCAMIKNMFDPGKYSSQEFQDALPEGAYKKSTTDRAGFQPTLPTGVIDDVVDELWDRGHNVDYEHSSDGTVIEDISYALGKKGVVNTCHSDGRGDLRAALRQASPAHPIIVRVKWDGNSGAHWIVVANANRRLGRTTILDILDPAYGGIRNRGTQVYTSRVGADGGGKGKFTNYWLRVDRYKKPKSYKQTGRKLPGM